MLRQFLRSGADTLSTPSTGDLAPLVQGYRLYARTEGKSDRTIAIVASSVGYLERFLCSEGLTTDVAEIGPTEIRARIEGRGYRLMTPVSFFRALDRLKEHVLKGVPLPVADATLLLKPAEGDPNDSSRAEGDVGLGAE